MFDLASFNARMAALKAALPHIGELVQAAHAIAPTAPGLAKADLVVSTLVAAEPALAEISDALRQSITGVVAAFRAGGTLPA